MKRIFILGVILLIFTAWVFTEEKSFVELHGSYLGQEPPGMIPEIFAPGIISTEKNELNSVFSPEGKEFYFTINTPGEGYRVYFSRETEAGWTKPELVTFSGERSDVDMCFSHDGKRMYFSSNRDIDGIKQEDFKIWYVNREGEKWGEAKYLRAPINSGKRALYPSISRAGTMFFQAIRDDSFNSRDIYYSTLKNEVYSEPVHLGREINTEYGEGDVLIAPDESYLIINSNGRRDDIGSGDLYISFKKSDGTWTELKNMGEPINSKQTEYCPMISPDGKYFFFTSRRSGNGDIYWVDARVIENLKHDEIKEEKRSADLTGLYMGQKRPGLMPELFAPGIISTEYREHCPVAVSPDGKELYFTRQYDNRHDIFWTRLKDGKWTKPVPVPFTSDYRDDGAAFSPDGKKLYFNSTRHAEGDKDTKEDSDIWYVERTAEGWGEPVRLGLPINTEANEGFPNFTEDGRMYFHADRESAENADIYYSDYKNGSFSEPVKLLDNINSKVYDAAPAVSPDGSYILFFRIDLLNDRKPGIRLSFKDEHDGWTDPVDFNKILRLPSDDLLIAKNTPDGKYIFILAGGDIYWVDAGIIQKIKKGLLKGE
ncbi:MAG: PD40 domain-containing protein [Acidobacteria bacterium]|nr:PD40 domain-containing protein [Acidobacteriota bacterium]